MSGSKELSQHSFLPFHFSDTARRANFLTSTPLISPSWLHVSLVHILFSAQTAGWRNRGVIVPHPGQWCKVKHAARTSTPLGRCLCTDTGAGGPGSLSWSKYPQCGRTSKYPGHCSDLRKTGVRWRCSFWCNYKCWTNAHFWTCTWCGHFLLRDTCSPPPSIPDRASPMSLPQCRMLQLSYRNNARLHEKHTLSIKNSIPLYIIKHCYKKNKKRPKVVFIHPMNGVSC